ncbi:MAG: hypothetical protein HY321_07855 [Armatimonadetes bacterium]|nr:hypothetical protein [Armatimonadota bacterium]
MTRHFRHASLALLFLCGGAITALLAPSAGVSSLLNEVPRYLIALAGAFAFYGLAGIVVVRAPDACSSRAGLAAILGVALAARLSLVSAEPTLSTDLFRYLWDGKVAAAGHNPYAFAPDAPELAPLRGPFWHRISYRSVRTPYPPVAQALFRLAAGIRQDDPIALKLLLVAADLAAVLALIGLLRRARRPAAHALLYAWNPLVISETALSGHVDALGVALFLLALLALERDDAAGQTAGALLLGLSLAAKPYALAALPVIARWRGLRVASLALAVAALTLAPYLDAGEHLMGGARAMARRWRNNGSLYEILYPALVGRVPFPGRTSRRILAGLLAAGCLLLARRPVDGREDLWRRLYHAFLLSLFTSPVAHPWYLVWLAPFLSLSPAASGFAFTALVSIKHLPRWLPPSIPVRLWVQYAPVYLLLAWEWWPRRKRRAGKPEGSEG